MAISTYTELQTAVENWLARTDLDDRIPEFISLAEAKFNRALRCNQMEKRSTASIDTGTDDPEFIALPGDFQSMKRVRLSSVSGKPQLEFKAQAGMDEYRTSIGNLTGYPRYFTIMGDELELCPTPDSNYTIEMVYRAYIPALASNSTNWLLALAPDAYLYGALMEASAHIKEDERVTLWAAGLKQAIDGLNGLAMDQAFGAGPLVMRTSSQVV